MLELKVRKLVNSLGVVSPKEVLNRLHVKDRYRVFLIATSEGGYRLTHCDPEFAAQMQLAEEGMARYRNTLHALT